MTVERYCLLSEKYYAGRFCSAKSQILHPPVISRSLKIEKSRPQSVCFFCAPATASLILFRRLRTLLLFYGFSEYFKSSTCFLFLSASFVSSSCTFFLPPTLFPFLFQIIPINHSWSKLIRIIRHCFARHLTHQTPIWFT